mgnify:CR=1 FL=1
MEPHLNSLIDLRDLLEWDVNFIYQTWLKGLYYGSDFWKQMKGDTYYSTYKRLIERILVTPGTKVKIACLKEDPEVVIGYAVYTGDTLHWAFVKPQWRKMGIAKAIIPDTIKKVTHLTKVGKSLKPKAWEFNPFLI